MDKKLIMIVVVNTVVILAIMAGGFYFVMNKMASYSAEPEKKQEGNGETQATAAAAGRVLALDTFIVNLSGEGGRRYLRITIELQLSGEAVQKEIQSRIPQVRDAVVMILPTRTVEELLSVEGKNTLRDAIMAKLNSILSTGTIDNLYFTEFVIQ